MIVFLVDPSAKAEEKERIGRAEQVVLDGWNLSIHYDGTEVADVDIHRVEVEEDAEFFRYDIDIVENGGHVHEHHGKDAVEVGHVPEKYEEGRDDQPYSDIEDHEASDGIDEEEKFPGEFDIIEEYEYEEDAEGESEVDEGGYVLRKEEEVFRYVYFGEDSCISHEGIHPSVGGFVKVGVDELSAEKVNRVVRYALSEVVGEDDIQDEECHQGIEDAPAHTEEGAFVFLLEVPLHQFFEEELVLFQFMS